jgi:hypothetical protein
MGLVRCAAPAFELASTGASVSLSRAPGLVVAVASLLGSIGVHIESMGRMMRAPVDAVGLHPAEIDSLARLDPAVRERARTIQWTRKEALLKATGFGLRIAPAAIDLGGIGVAAPANEVRLGGTFGTGASPVETVDAAARGGGTFGKGASPEGTIGAHITVQLRDAPDTLRNDLDLGRFTPMFADPSGFAAHHPHADRVLVGSICEPRPDDPAASTSARRADDTQYRGADGRDQQHRHRE